MIRFYNQPKSQKGLDVSAAIRLKLLPLERCPCLFDLSNNCGSLNVEINGSVHEEKLAFKTLGLSFT